MPGPETIVRSCSVCPAFLKVSVVATPACSVRLAGSKRNSLAATRTPLGAWLPGPQAARSSAQSAGSRRLMDGFKVGLLKSILAAKDTTKHFAVGRETYACADGM